VNFKSKSRILLVEDETLVRIVGSDALTDAGFEVLEAASADDALRILETADEVSVLLTDIRMPGSMDGLQLAHLVHARWPAIKILLTSGDTWPQRDAIPDDGRFLAKPYDLQTLQDEVEGLIRE